MRGRPKRIWYWPEAHEACDIVEHEPGAAGPEHDEYIHADVVKALMQDACKFGLTCEYPDCVTDTEDEYECCPRWMSGECPMGEEQNDGQ